MTRKVPTWANGEPNLEAKCSTIFSQRNGHVWVSWPESAQPVDLGIAHEVEAMMRDYLAQGACAKRLMALARTIREPSH